MENNNIENIDNEVRKEKFEEIRVEVEPILKTLENNYSIEKGEDGTETIIVYGRNNEIVASINEKGKQFFNAEFEQNFMELEEKVNDVKNKVKYNKEKEASKEVNKDEKKLENENATSKEEIKKELGDEYVVAAEINDEEISKKLIATEGFIGNPLMAYNKKTNQFVIIGNNGAGKLQEAKLLTISAQTSKNIDKYNYDGSIVQERALTGQSIMLLPPENNDGIDLRVNEYGEIEINKIVNLRGDNPQSFPIDTKQRVPSSQEISDMKAKGEKMEEITDIIDKLEAKGIIDKDEKNELQEEIATNGKTVEEDKKMLNKLEEENEEKIEESQEITKDLDDDDEYDPRDPRAKDPRWA